LGNIQVTLWHITEGLTVKESEREGTRLPRYLKHKIGK